MEGTLGAADRITFREGMREAALSASLAQVRFARQARECPSFKRMRTFPVQESPFLCRSGFATEGVRADRVGEKTFHYVRSWWRG
jgi:hypothetical protein